MKSNLQSGTSDKVEWFKNHSLTEGERKKLIDEKVSRAMKFLALSKKKK